MNNTKMRFSSGLFLISLIAALIAPGCKKDKDTEQELITRVEVQLTGINGSTFNEEFVAEDLDANGIWDAPPSLDIPANTVFDVQVQVYDGNGNVIDSEIRAESNEHLFTYTIAGANLFIDNFDLDDNGKTLGAESRWSAGNPSSGTVQIKLYHEPTNKDNLSDPGGEVDFDVTFPVSIQ